MIVGTKRPPESCRKTQESQENQKTYALNLSRLLGIMGGREWVALMVQYDKITYRAS
jgi:hypothetical protein